MPWKLYNENEKWCVHKLGADDSKGELVACHDTRGEALAQQRALYASESKEITDATLDLLKEIAEDGNDSKPERASAVLDEWKERISAIPTGDEDEPEATPETSDPENKEQEPAAEQEELKPPVVKKDLLGKLKELADAVASWFKGDDDGAIGSGVYNSDLSIWKEGDVYWWVARYSNKFRDQDNPPEIISSESHQNFVRMVKEGKEPMPELWLWHKKNWKVGKAHGVEYDTTGFAIAIGTFDAGREPIAEALMKSKQPLRVSHGMPVSSIERDPADPSIIVRHTTREISPLPEWAAANKLTGFAVLESKEESTMAIPDETKKEWVTDLGIDPQTLESLEAANAQDANKAVSEGLESKETDEASAQPATPADVTAPEASEPAAAPEQPAQATDLTPLRNAVTEAVSTLVTPLMERISQLEETMKEIKEASEKQKEMLVGTPSASLQALITGYAQSAIGAEATKVDGRTGLAKSKPKEAASPANGKTLIPFVNELMGQQ